MGNTETTGVVTRGSAKKRAERESRDGAPKRRKEDRDTLLRNLFGDDDGDPENADNPEDGGGYVRVTYVVTS